MLQSRASIAVVDDEEPVRLALARMLRASDFEVSVYASGEDFIASLALGQPDCVILDLQMPGMTGRDVQRSLTTAGASLPIIVITAFDRPTQREQCLADGAVAYLTKPVRRDQVVSLIDVALRRVGRDEMAPP